MDKHAYLIIAHNQFELLYRLLELIDDNRNDIFIHIDKKTKDVDFKKIASHVKKASLFFTERTSVWWGGYSQINAELLLLKKATETATYSYYHLVSGIDLPIKTQDYIHEFFAQQNGKEFVGYDDTEIKNFSIKKRVRFYHPFQDITGRTKSIYYYLEELIIAIQKIFHTNRQKGNNTLFQKGCNWFSITDKLARYTVSKEEEIKKTYKFTKCCDEIFLQTLVWNSEFKNNIYAIPTSASDDTGSADTMRYIDWKRGTPYTFKDGDLDEIMASDMLFARKFNIDTHPKIIYDIYDKIKQLQTF
ncbi:MAG: beta-1,6-N-acetylglucosaminyltransferase [Synergistaceae bacterium]